MRLPGENIRWPRTEPGDIYEQRGRRWAQKILPGGKGRKQESMALEKLDQTFPGENHHNFLMLLTM